MQGSPLLTGCPSSLSRWAFLDLGTNGSYNDSLQAYAAGVVEASVSEEVRPVWESRVPASCPQPSQDILRAFRGVDACAEKGLHLLSSLRGEKEPVLQEQLISWEW